MSTCDRALLSAKGPGATPDRLTPSLSPSQQLGFLFCAEPQSPALFGLVLGLEGSTACFLHSYWNVRLDPFRNGSLRSGPPLPRLSRKPQHQAVPAQCRLSDLRRMNEDTTSGNSSSSPGKPKFVLDGFVCSLGLTTSLYLRLLSTRTMRAACRPSLGLPSWCLGWEWDPQRGSEGPRLRGDECEVPIWVPGMANTGRYHDYNSQEQKEERSLTKVTVLTKVRTRTLPGLLPS